MADNTPPNSDGIAPGAAPFKAVPGPTAHAIRASTPPPARAASQASASQTVALTFAFKPHLGETWLLEPTEHGLILRVGQRVMASIPNGYAGLRIRFPRFLGSLFLTIRADDGQLFYFEPNEKDLTLVRRLVAQCLKKAPGIASFALGRKGDLDLFTGFVSIFWGGLVAAWSYAFPGGKLVIAIGLLVVGFVEVVRGIWFKVRANSS